MKKVFKILPLLIMILVVVLGFSGCRRPFDVPEFVTIEPSQTAFLIPLVGDTAEQGAFESEELLASAKVATKEVQIPHRWVQTGRRKWQGNYKASARLIVVERKPVTREWTADSSTGTSTSNQGIMAESKGSISFSVSMNVSAQIDESNATKFLYRYNNKPLSEVMDSDIRASIESLFVEECASREMSEILDEKREIMATIREKVINQFKERGVTITVLGLKGDVVYADSKIQEAINKEFKAIKDQEAQVIINKTNVEKAQAEAEAKKIAQQTTNEMNIAKAEAENAVKIAIAEAEAEAIRLRASTLKDQMALMELEIQLELVKTWNGEYPQMMMGGGDTVNLLPLPELE